MNPNNTTVIICCAGMGTKKALVNICGKPLIIHQLEQLEEYDDIRIVLGFQAENVIKVVKKYRKDIMFAFDYEYESTGYVASLCKGGIKARQYIIVIDGDLLVNPDDFKLFLDYQGECLAASTITSEESVLLTVKDGQAMAFSEEDGNFEWPGLAKLERNRLQKESGYVFDMIRPLLPVKVINVRGRKIDILENYEKQ